MTYHPLIKLPK